jgi:hypothetical protein
MVKVKQSQNTPTEAQEERRYSSYSFMTSAVYGCEWSDSRSGRALLSGIGPQVPIGQEAGWDPEPVWTQSPEEKTSCLCWESNLDHPVVQSVARHYTGWATPAPQIWMVIMYIPLRHSYHTEGKKLTKYRYAGNLVLGISDYHFGIIPLWLL